jgi:hypothetical protein
VPFSSNLQVLGLGVEAVARGTAAASTVYIPLKSPAWTPNLTILDDTGLRGDMNDFHGQAAGMRYDDFSFTCDVFADTFPHLMRGILGSADTKTGTTSPYLHVFSLLNTGTGQPPSYTLQYFDGLDCNQFLESQLDTANVSWTADGLLSCAPKFICRPATTISLTSETYSTEIPVPSWDAIVSVGGTPITKAVSGEIILSRGTKPIPAVTGTQQYYQNWAGPLSTKASKLTVIMESDTELNYFLNNTQGIAFDLKFVNPASVTEFIQFHYSNTGWRLGKKNPGKEWMEIDLEVAGVPSTSDATAGGTSPIKVSVSNTVSTSY